MKETKVIARKNLPSRLPIASSVVAYLFLDKINAPGWAWGVACTVYAIGWIAAIVGLVKETDIDLFDMKEGNTWAQKLRETMERNKQ